MTLQLEKLIAKTRLFFRVASPTLYYLHALKDNIQIITFFNILRCKFLLKTLKQYLLGFTLIFIVLSANPTKWSNTPKQFVCFYRGHEYFTTQKTRFLLSISLVNVDTFVENCGLVTLQKSLTENCFSYIMLFKKSFSVVKKKRIIFDLTFVFFLFKTGRVFRTLSYIQDSVFFCENSYGF